MNSSTVKSFSRAMKHGSKYVYQTVPRLLTIWLDLGEDRRSATQETFKRLNEVVAKAIKEAPVYKVTTLSMHLFPFLFSISGLLRSLKSYLGLGTRMTRCSRISRN
jgi:hypothetical protein